jgi:hypothetical protein
MGSYDSDDSAGAARTPGRERRNDETEAEQAFWCRYWEVLRTAGGPIGQRDLVRMIRAHLLAVYPGIQGPKRRPLAT